MVEVFSIENRSAKTVVTVAGVAAAIFLSAAVCFAQSPGDATSRVSTISMSKVFTFMFVMLGPFKVLAPFVNLTKAMDAEHARIAAFKAFVIACIAGVLAGVVGQLIIANWNISMPALLASAGLVLLLVALEAIMAQFRQTREAPAEASAPAGKPTMLSAMPLAFPGIITPYGIAAFILLLSAAEPGKPIAIFGIFLGVMVLDLLAMLYARPIVKYCLGPLIVVNSVLGVLQVALAVQMLIIAGQMLGVVPDSAR